MTEIARRTAQWRFADTASRARRFQQRATELRQLARTYRSRERRLQLELLAEDCDESYLVIDDRPSRTNARAEAEHVDQRRGVASS
jgi:hypothetical protein